MHLGDLSIFTSKSFVSIPKKIFLSKEYFVQGYGIFWSKLYVQGYGIFWFGYTPEREEDIAPRAVEETSID
jgi:hypothetical protein